MDTEKICAVCYDDIVLETEVLYQLNIDDQWKPFQYCKECVLFLLNSQWDVYISGLRKADCEASLKKLIERGPPSRFRDARIEDGNELHQFKCNSDIISSALPNCMDDEKMVLLNTKLKELLPLLSDNIGEQKYEDFDYMNSINKLLDELSL